MMEDLIKQKEYQCKKIFSDPYCLVCRQEHPCLTENGIDFELLSNEPFIMHSPEKAPYLVKQVLHVCKESNYTPNITNYYKNMEELLFAVESGLGITILPLRLKLYLTTNLIYTPIDVPTCSTIGIAWIDSKDNPSTKWFMDLMSRYF